MANKDYYNGGQQPYYPPQGSLVLPAKWRARRTHNHLQEHLRGGDTTLSNRSSLIRVPGTVSSNNTEAQATAPNLGTSPNHHHRPSMCIQQPAQSSGVGAGTGCLACLAGACLCCCAEEALCDCLF
ncbi:hypothetical protein PAXRUDRAFT_701334 [Paxillus rubicundulus Ve08.2h10]|uniref:Cysteine-rich transmembrane CYSTM domain-containing protein n=1 Tax=Paxillus rubicundulus Ve08.2h10 TaxID=930991 RepID=A0A0D0DN00_9AGAM|nr:hypothetical protein PAXRUDRAFT_701334 [Paxillus rubicundulus Ve08.2h10]